MDEPGLSEQVRHWLQADADANYGGDAVKAAYAILEAAFVAAQNPDDPWAGLTHLARSRAGGRR
jgi:hypothetical protein